MSTNEEPQPTGHSIKRFRIGFNVIVQIALGIVIVGAINFLSCRKYLQWDRTPTNRYTLGERSKEILGALPRDVQLTVLFRRHSDVFGYVNRMMELYEKAAGGKLHYRMVDPERDPATISELRNRNPKLFFNDNMILVDAEGGAQQILKDKDMFDRDESTFLSESSAVRGRVITYRLESALTSAILAASEKRKQVVYVVAGKGDLRRAQGVFTGDAFGLLQIFGRQQNMDVTELYLSSRRPIPENASAVVLIAPKQDFTGRELKQLFDVYWNRRRGGLLILIEPSYLGDLPNLVDHLRAYYGVEVVDDRFLSVKSQGGQNIKVFETPVAFHPEFPVTEDLRDRTTVLARESCSVAAVDDALLPRDLHHTPLMFAIDGFWKEKDYRAESVILEPGKKEDLDPHVAIALERGSGMSEQLRLDSSRMVVIGNGSLMDPDLKTRESVEFILNSVNWISDRDNLVGGIEAKNAGRFRVRISDAQYEKLQRISLQVLPACVFLLGCMIAFMRRR